MQIKAFRHQNPRGFNWDSARHLLPGFNRRQATSRCLSEAENSEHIIFTLRGVQILKRGWSNCSPAGSAKKCWRARIHLPRSTGPSIEHLSNSCQHQLWVQAPRNPLHANPLRSWRLLRFLRLMQIERIARVSAFSGSRQRAFFHQVVKITRSRCPRGSCDRNIILCA